MLLVEFGALPLFCLQHLAQMLHGVPHVFKADVEGREAKAQNVFVLATIASTVVANDAARNKGLHDGKGTFVAGEADLRAAPGVFAWGGQAQAVAGAAFFDELDENRSVSASDLARSAAMPPSFSAASKPSRPQPKSDRLTMGWVPQR